jgi:hypothetical protein
MGEPQAFGPILVHRGLADGQLRLAALFGRAATSPAPAIQTDSGAGQLTELARIDDFIVSRIDFALPLTGAAERYVCDGRESWVQTGFDGDVRIAFVACNGQEHDDFTRPEPLRNAMWHRLGAEHAATPFALLLHGGDQIYADEDVRVHPLTEGWPESLPREVTADQMRDIETALRRAFVRRYAQLYASDGFASICRQVPSLAMWDDHDICDGWGSLERSRTRSAIGQGLFRVAREMFLLFQHAATDADVPALFADREGVALGWRRRFPGFEVLAPDLRSERGRRQIMGARGWALIDGLRRGPTEARVFMVSSVPLLGPRLSLLERVLMLVPSMQKYEDDLRDQWQSHAHRTEWRRMLSACLEVLERSDLTVLSGEIHLATRARMRGGARDLIQLVASGIAHKAPPQGYARALGWLAGLGEAPLPAHPIRIEPLPGQSRRYVAERNYLVLTRRAQAWTAEWELEDSGRTRPLPI